MMYRVWMKVGPGKIFLLFGLSILFGLSERVSVQSPLPLHLLAVLNDQYYLVFAVLPVFLFLCTGVMEDDTLLVLVRYGTYGRYFFHKWRALSVIAALFWVGQMAALLLSGLGFPVVGSWPGALDGQWREVFTLLQGYFPWPWAAILCCAGQMLLGYLLIALAALFLGHFCGLWPLGVFCTQVIGECSVFLTIRLRRRKEFLGALLYTGLLWILLYGCLLTLAAVIPPILLDFSLDMGLLVTAVGLKLLDVVLQFLLILSAFCVTGQATAGLVAVVLSHFLCVLPIPWLPVGISSLTG